ncbi:MAG TPA: putative Ig domain-containing protein [Terriglobales bacterium]|jgi:hypothetical protein|nr:putative Ig domain-containing protein [Terriglobales bacterium]
MNSAARIVLGLSAAIALLVIGGCGGGGGGGGGGTPIQPPPNPTPQITSISPTGATTFGTQFTLTVNGNGFVSASSVRWNGEPRFTTFVNSTQLTAAIAGGDLSHPGSFPITVFNPPPGGGTSNAVDFAVSAGPLRITTSQLPPSSSGKAYFFSLGSEGGAPPITWQLAPGSGPLPSGLSLDASGRISGTLAAVGSNTTASFTVQASDSNSTPQTDTKALSLLVRASGPGRNESCATATPISNGRLRASLSPYGDHDFYSFQATQGAQVTIETFAQRLDLDGNPFTVDSHADTMLQLLNSNCASLAVNDDIHLGFLLDSQIVFIAPYGGTNTYFVQVLDWRGDGRPDLLYDLQLTGAN